jgi:hypothetical protein
MYIGLYVKCRYSCQILLKIEIPLRFLEKLANIKFQENPSSGNRVVPCGRTNIIHDEANGRLSQFCERA